MLKVSRHKRPKKKKEKRISSSDDDDVPFWGFVIAAGMQMLGQGMAASQQRSQQRRILAQQRKQQLLAYNIARQETEGEVAWRNKMGERMSYGDPDLKRRQNLYSQPIRQMGEERRQFAQGQSIKQGLENSIVAHELRRKVDNETLKSLGQVAEKIALYNDDYKKRAEEKLDQYNLQRGQMLRQLAAGFEANRPIDTTMTDSEMFGSIFANTLGNFGSMYMQSAPGQESMNDFFGGWFN